MRQTIKNVFYLLWGVLLSTHLNAQSLNNKKIDGYRGIWFELGQKYPYGDKYSGGLSTYTAKHIPLAIYAPEVDKTFFVYGGTTKPEETYLLAMIGEYDHATGKVSKPTVVYDKQGVYDPHDNPSLMIDEHGYLWVFVSGRSTKRPGIKLRSKVPFSIDAFSQVAEEEFTYPQPWKTEKGYFHFFTKYKGRRLLYFETSKNLKQWSDDRQLAAIPDNEGENAGHYQVSNVYQGKKVATFFNRHIKGHPDTRTDLYYLRTEDMGKSWQDVRGNDVQIPITKKNSSTRVINYSDSGSNVYLKDMRFDDTGNPICLYIRSGGHQPGPKNAPYEWCITKWDGSEWKTIVITTSDHNYDMGSLIVDKGAWQVIGPTGIGPQKYGAGGEIAVWVSKDKGESWKKAKDLTSHSYLNHNYVRRIVDFKSPFCLMWANGHYDRLSQSHIYFADLQGNAWQLPYNMDRDHGIPVKMLHGQSAWHEIRPDFGYIWLDGEHTDKHFLNRLSIDKVDSVTFTGLLAKARSHDGAGIKFNGGKQLYFKPGENEIIQLSTVNVPVNDVKCGINQVRFESFHSEGMKYNNNSHVLKLYFDPEDPPKEISSVPNVNFIPPLKALGDSVRFSIEAQDFDGIKRVEYWVYGDFFPTVDVKAPDFVQWHKVASSSEFPFSATWDTKLFPDQSGMKIKAMVYDNEQIVVETAVSEDHYFDRSFYTMSIMDRDIDRISFWKEGVNDSVWFDADLPENGQEAYVMIFAWLAAKGYYTEGALGTVKINDKSPYDIMMRHEYPDAWTSIIKTNVSDWKSGKNLIRVKTNSPFGKSMMFSTPPGPVLYYIYDSR